MKTIVLLAVFAIGTFFCANAQQVEKDSMPTSSEQKIAELKSKKEDVRESEKDKLKKRVEAIQERLEEEEISKEKADSLKRQAAEKSARNIEDQLDLIDLNIALVRRNQDSTDVKRDYINIGQLLTKAKIPIDSVPDLTRVYFGLGLGMAGLNTSGNTNPYKGIFAGGVQFHFNTVLSRKDPHWRLNYGMNAAIEGFSLKDDQILIDENDKTVLKKMPESLSYSRFYTTQVLFPVHIEFGGAPIAYGDKSAYYAIKDHWRGGIGGFFGFKTISTQSFKYKDQGKFMEVTHHRSFNTHNFQYGLGGYVAWRGYKLFVRYHLNKMFKDAEVNGNAFMVGMAFSLNPIIEIYD